MPPDLAPACRLTAAVVAGVPEESLDGSTPCPELSVAEVVAHVHGLAQAFGAAARKDLGPLTDTDPGDGGSAALPPGWREETQDHLAALAVAWEDPAAWEGTTRAGGVDMPAEVAGLVALDEVVVHGWDLAVSTGQEYAPDDDTTGAVLELLTGWRAEGVPPDIFGPEVAVAPGAPPMHRVAGLAGRDPLWVPAQP